jgi:hypothetical protein
MLKIVSTEKTWAANANGRYGWCYKHTMSDGSIRWEHSA